MTDPTSNPAAPAHGQACGNAGVPFWDDQDGNLFCVNPGSSPQAASAMAALLIGYVAERLVPAVEGTQDPKKAIRGDEAFILRFVLTAASALVEAMPTGGLDRGQ